jgi:hypothetical protein
MNGDLVEDIAQWLRDLAEPEIPAQDELLIGALTRLSGRQWLRLEQAFRSGASWERPGRPAPLWRQRLSEAPTLVIVGAASMHADGFLREEALGMLATSSDPLAAAFIALRTTDWVDQVRGAAGEALLERVGIEDAWLALPVLWSGEIRVRATGLAERYSIEVGRRDDTVVALATHSDRATALWAIEMSERRRLLTEEFLLRLAQESGDQVVSEHCARTLAAREGGPSPSAARELLGSRRSTLRWAALEKLPADLLDEGRVTLLAYDRSASVRLLARWRLRRTGRDPEQVYDVALSQAASGAQLIGCLLGWSEVESPSRVDVARFTPYLTHGSSGVRRAAVIAIGRRGDHRLVVEFLLPMLEDPTWKVATAALRQLKPHGIAVPSTTIERLAVGDNADGRRLAFSARQSRGGWERVTADLEAAVGGDALLASSARADLGSWLSDGAAGTRGVPTPEQAVIMSRTLPVSGLDASQQRLIAFHARIGFHEPELDDDRPDTPRRTLWRFWS